LQEETKKLYAENNVSPYAGCLPLLVQMPVMMALYQAILRIPELRSGHFLWLNLSQSDPYFILPILAAVFTFASSYLSSMSQLESNASLKIMNFAMPVMIFVMALNLASGLSLYWVISNAFQVVQTLLINNPFKIRREREEAARQIRERERALQKAKHPKKKRKK
jgi:YidC/Oxa1 family membrane protein insertase